MKYYDIGLNLFCRQFPDPEKIIADAINNGVCCILTGTDTKENRKINSFVKTHDVYGTVGIHPHNADRARQEDFQLIEKILSENSKMVAVGECGLDYDRMFSTKENQVRCFEKHIVLAERFNKPLFLHERSATDDFIKRFKKHPDICKKSVVHCFTGDRTTLDKYLSMGFSIGITGWICDDRRGRELREAVSIIPLDRIMVETDAPFLQSSYKCCKEFCRVWRDLGMKKMHDFINEEVKVDGKNGEITNVLGCALEVTFFNVNDGKTIIYPEDIEKYLV